MATVQNYDTRIATDEESVSSATKFWTIIVGLITIIGLLMLAAFFMSDSAGTEVDPVKAPAERTASGP